MWVEKKPSWLATVLLGGFALPHIWWRTLSVTAVSVAVTLLYEEIPTLHHAVTATPFTLVGLPLGIFLGFRNNTAYDRFWEGRKLWGALVNTSRSLTRQILTLIEAQTEGESEESIEAFERRYVHLVIAFVHALRHHLRNTSSGDELVELVGEEEAARVRHQENVPYAICQRLGELLLLARRRRWVNEYHVPVIEASLTSLTDIQGACERIKSTPIPYSYSVLMHRIVGVYCTLLPFGLMESINWATPAVVLVISYCFFGLDAIGDELEQPFGTDINDLPLKAISRTIERNLRERLGEQLPPAHAPDGGILD